MVKKLNKLPAYLRHVGDIVNPIVEIVNKGIVIDTSEIIAERLQDGRVRLRLHPQIRDRYE